MDLSRSIARHARIPLLALGLVTTVAALSACDDDMEVLCVGMPVAVSTVPQQITVAPGDSAVITATVVSGKRRDCDGRTHTLRNAVAWSSSNAAVAAITPLDSLRARVFGVAHGQTTVIATVVDEPNAKGASAVVVP